VERADIEKLFTFTGYGWSQYEETIRPRRRGTDESGAGLGLAGAA
jgi:hypothetical protein